MALCSTLARSQRPLLAGLPHELCLSLQRSSTTLAAQVPHRYQTLPIDGEYGIFIRGIPVSRYSLVLHPYAQTVPNDRYNTEQLLKALLNFNSDHSPLALFSELVRRGQGHLLNCSTLYIITWNLWKLKSRRHFEMEDALNIGFKIHFHAQQILDLMYAIEPRETRSTYLQKIYQIVMAQLADVGYATGAYDLYRRRATYGIVMDEKIFSDVLRALARSLELGWKDASSRQDAIVWAQRVLLDLQDSGLNLNGRWLPGILLRVMRYTEQGRDFQQTAQMILGVDIDLPSEPESEGFRALIDEYTIHTMLHYLAERFRLSTMISIFESLTSSFSRASKREVDDLLDMATTLRPNRSFGFQPLEALEALVVSSPALAHRTIHLPVWSSVCGRYNLKRLSSGLYITLIKAATQLSQANPAPNRIVARHYFYQAVEASNVALIMARAYIVRAVDSEVCLQTLEWPQADMRLGVSLIEAYRTSFRLKRSRKEMQTLVRSLERHVRHLQAHTTWLGLVAAQHPLKFSAAPLKPYLTSLKAHTTTLHLCTLSYRNQFRRSTTSRAFRTWHARNKARIERLRSFESPKKIWTKKGKPFFAGGHGRMKGGQIHHDFQERLGARRRSAFERQRVFEEQGRSGGSKMPRAGKSLYLWSDPNAYRPARGRSLIAYNAIKDGPRPSRLRFRMKNFNPSERPPHQSLNSF